MKKRISVLLALVIMTFSFFTGCNNKEATVVDKPYPSESASVSADPIPEETTTQYVEPVTVSLVAVGDMLMHAGASIPAKKADGSYNYDYIFANVKANIEAADIAVANEEVIFGGNDKGNIGYPEFNVRTELGDALVNNGFDVILHATNHTMDQSTAGINNALNFWRTAHPDTKVLGIHFSEDEASNITVIDKKGIKIAMLNYTYGLNGFDVPQGMDYIVDLMNDNTKSKIADDIKRAKEISDIVVVYPHWGTEYNMGISDEQSKWASFFAENGVDLVIGTHPHVVEPVKWVTASNGNKTLVYYSLGNFISIQYYNYCMLGGMAKISITKDSTGTHISDYGMDFLVTHFTPGRTAVTTYLLDNYTDALAGSHAILTEPGEKFMTVNKDYPFTVAGLKNLAKSICPDMVKY